MPQPETNVIETTVTEYLQSIFNSTSGVFNISFNSSQSGAYYINFSVNDTTSRYSSFVLGLNVYDYPQILLPASSYSYNLKENVSSSFNFSVNHSVGDNLTYVLKLNNITINTSTGLGNGNPYYINFTPNFTQETTCSGAVSLELNVSNGKLSNVTSWNMTINHTNSPLVFLGEIPDTTLPSLPLSNYFYDLDAEDTCINQTVGFKHTLINSSGGTITVTITNWQQELLQTSHLLQQNQEQPIIVLLHLNILTQVMILQL